MTVRHLLAMGSLIALPMILASEATADDLDGVKHAVAVSIQADPKITPGTPRGTMTLLIRISAHSQSADFAGEITEKFENIDFNEGTPFRTIWSQDKCHQRRGLPRIWILRLSGLLTQGGVKTQILSEPRAIGVELPNDELKTVQQVETVNLADHSERILRAHSQKSHFLVEVRLTSTSCAR